MGTFSFPKAARLLRPGDYAKVFDDVQVRIPDKHFLILATPNSLGHARIGLIFSKRNLKLAVQRNRIKRLVRESFRLNTNLPAMDIVVLGRQGLATQPGSDVARSLEHIWQRLIRKSASVQEKSREPDASSGVSYDSMSGHGPGQR